MEIRCVKAIQIPLQKKKKKEKKVKIERLCENAGILCIVNLLRIKQC